MFGHDTAMALRGGAALVNTVATQHGPHAPPTPDALLDLPSLHAFLAPWSWTGAQPSTREELDAVREVRSRMRGWWTDDEAAVVEDVNDLFATARASLRVVRHGEYGWHVHALPDDAPLHHRMAVECAVAVVDLLRAEDLSRLKVCRANACEQVLVDLSRNRSRHFCSTACGDRTHAASYRARRASSPS